VKFAKLIMISCFISSIVGSTFSEGFQRESVTVPVDWNSGLMVRNMLPSDISYFIIDLKYSPERGVTYIEFGNGLSAGYKVLDHTIGKGIIYQALWKILRGYQLPMWYVGSEPRSEVMTAWSDYIQQGGNHANNVVEIVSEPHFARAVLSDPPSNVTMMKGKKGIIVVRDIKRGSLRQKQFIDTYGDDFIIINKAIYRYVSDKRLTSLLFNTDYLKTFRPKSKAYPREYSPDLAGQIISDIDCEWFVIKPVRSTQGNGILMVHKDELDEVLKKILKRYHNNKPYDNNYLFARYSPLVDQYWKHDRNSHFLVEEYVNSKPIYYENKHYDATMRVVVLMHYDQGRVRMEFINQYWKRPIMGLEDLGTFREKHLSKHAPNYLQSLGGDVSKSDKKGVHDGLMQSLPQIYLNMLTDHYLTHEFTSEVEMPFAAQISSARFGHEIKTTKKAYQIGGKKHILFNS